MITSTTTTPAPQSPISAPPKRLTDPRWDQCRVYGSVALATPAVRLVLVEGWAHQGETGHSIHAVIAIASALTSEYCRARRPGAVPKDPSTSPEKLEADGWRLEWTGSTHDCIVIDPQSGELCEARHAFDSVNSVYRVVAAAWDASEDDLRLASTIAVVERQAIKRAAEAGMWTGSHDVAASVGEEVDQ